MSFNPNAIFISPSSLADFDKCPQLYFYRNVYKSPRGLKIQIINPSLALGQAVHDTLSRFLKLLPGQRNKDELFQIFDFHWQNLSGEKGGFRSLEEEKGFRERALGMLERFWGNQHFKEAEAVKIPDFPKLELGNDLILTGKLDWLEKNADGYHVIDFKTGKEEREDSVQLPIYSLLAGKIVNSSQIKTSYWYLDRDDNLTSVAQVDHETTLSLLRQKGGIIKMVRQTNSFRCQSGQESCWACREMLAVAQGKGKLVSLDPVNRKQEIYILVPDKEEKAKVVDVVEELPF